MGMFCPTLGCLWRVVLSWHLYVARRLVMLEWWSKQTVGWQLATSGTRWTLNRSADVAAREWCCPCRVSKKSPRWVWLLRRRPCLWRRPRVPSPQTPAPHGRVALTIRPDDAVPLTSQAYWPWSTSEVSESVELDHTDPSHNGLPPTPASETVRGPMQWPVVGSRTSPVGSRSARLVKAVGPAVADPCHGHHEERPGVQPHRVDRASVADCC